MVETNSIKTIRLEITGTSPVSTKPIPTKDVSTNDPLISTKPPEPVKWDGDGLPLYGSVAKREAALEHLRASRAAQEEAAWLARRKLRDPGDLNDRFSSAAIARRTYATVPDMGEDREGYRARVKRERLARQDAASAKARARSDLLALGRAERNRRGESIRRGSL